jgi:DNA-binding response OmpR family regulator
VDGAGRIRVVVVDDDEPVLRLLRDVFEGEGYEVVTLPHPPRDPAELAALAPDLLVLDLHFAVGGNGAAILATVKTDPATAALPVLVCSAARHLLDRMAADLERWSCGVVAKPFDLDVLLAAVRDCLHPPARDEAAG